MTKDTHILFKTIFDQSPISTQIFTPDGETYLVNNAWEQLWNIKFAELKKYNILKDQQLVETGIMPYIKRGFKGEVVSLPAIRYIAPKSVSVKSAVQFRWLSATMYPIKEDGIIEYLVLQHKDITERKEAEEEKQLFTSIVKSSRDAIISKNLDGIIQTWNKSAEKMFGFTQEEAIGKHITVTVPTELRSEETEIISKIKRGIPIRHYQTVRWNKQHKRFPVSISISPVTDMHGKIIGAANITRDITEEKNTETKIRESEERLRIALDAGKIGVWDWNIADNKLTWTDKVYSIHGVNKNKFKVSFQNFKKLIHPDDKKRVFETIEKTLKGTAKFIIEFRIITPAGKIRWVSTQANVFCDENNKPIRLLGATSEITQQKQIEQEKNDFLSMASHELRTPITSMKMFVDLLYNTLKKEKNEKPLYLAHRVREQTNRLKELINNLLDVSRIETGKLQLNKDIFNISSLVHETVDGIQASTKNKIEVKKLKNFRVFGDKYRIYQVLINLITNASKYSDSDTKIIISVSRRNNHAVVSVQDFGIGIAQDKHKKIFDRLYQVDDTPVKTFPGLGLGLFISKQIIEKHDGKIWVSSKKGKGSTFIFTLPLKN